MVDDFAISRLHFERADEVVFGEFRWNDEAAVNVVAFGGEFVVFVGFEDDVWFAEGPGFGELRSGWEIGGFSLGGIGVGPLFEQDDLFGG